MNTSQIIATFSDPSIFLKAFEFILTIISMSVEQGGMAVFVSAEFFFGGTLVMCAVVSGLLFVLFTLGQQRDIQKTYFELSFNAIASLFQLAAGSVAINEYTGQEGTAASHAFTAGSFCIITCAMYAWDCYYAFVNYRSLTMHPDSSATTPPPPPREGGFE